MFNSHALPPPSNFAQEQRPLRLTSDIPRPLPAGECRFVPLYPLPPTQCPCQSFHHNRSVPGSSCDCGHQACYHTEVKSLHTINSPPLENLAAANAALLERVKRLEESLKHERHMRDAAILEERRSKDTEIRMLREALYPFYRSEEDMRSKLIELEDRIEGNYDEQVRIRERVVALDDANMALERRLEDAMDPRAKRQRLSGTFGSEQTVQLTPRSRKRSSEQSSADDFMPMKSSSSGAVSPSHSHPFVADSDEPRSSGILNLIHRSKPRPYQPPRWISPPRHEARSSGFLALDLDERFARKASGKAPPAGQPLASTNRPDPTGAPPKGQQRQPHPGEQQQQRILGPATVVFKTHHDPTVAADKDRPMSIEVQEILLPGDGGIDVDRRHALSASPKKRKQEDGDLMALDMLARVSASRTMAR